MQMQYLRALARYWDDPARNPVSGEYGGPMIDMTRAFVWAWDTRPYPCFPNNRALWSDGRSYARGHWLNGRSGTQPLSVVVAEICRRAGLYAFDVSRLFGVVRGYAIDQVGDARAALQPLMLRFGFDAVERDGMLVFKMRDGRRAVTLDPETLAVSAELAGAVELTRDADAELAGRIRLRFVQADGAFETIAEEAVLADDATHAVATSELNIALTRAEGHQIAERWLAEARIARDTVRLALPPSLLDLGAGDVIRLPADAQQGDALYRIDRIERGDVQLVDAVRIDPETYAPAPFEDSLVALKPYAAPVPVNPLFLNLSLLRGDEVPHAPHIAATAAPWPGSVAVYQSGTDSDYRLGTVLPLRATIGVTENDLAAARPGLIDHGAGVQVKLTSGTLQSVSTDALLAGANFAAIGDGSADNWEVFQFAQAELIAPGTYWLTGRLRGQAGTDALMPQVWPQGSRFVLLNSVPQQLDLSPNLRRIVQHFRIGPARRPLIDPSYLHASAAFDGNGLRPLSPCHLGVTETAAGHDLRWIRRSRIGGDDWDGLDIPLGEEAERYVVQVSQAGQIWREAVIATPSWQYSRDMRIADQISGAFTFSVAQVSAIYGAGPSARLLIGEN